MVDLDFRAGCSLVGGIQPAVSGHYRFRGQQVYRPAALFTIRKFVPQEPIMQDETGLRRNGATLPANRMCSAITGFIAGRLCNDASGMFAFADLPATLILET
jgi:hypothetical protein